MQKLSKIMITTGAIVGAIALGGSLLTQSASAHMDGASNTMVQKIATRFNLNQADVQSVFDEMHTVRQKEMQAQLEARLSEAVSKGVLSEAQKQELINKLKEFHTQMEQLRDDKQNPQNMTEEQRQAWHEQHKTLMQSHQQALKDWATANGIDWSALQPYLGPGKGHVGRGKGGWGMAPDMGIRSSSSTSGSSAQ